VFVPLEAQAHSLCKARHGGQNSVEVIVAAEVLRYGKLQDLRPRIVFFGEKSLMCSHSRLYEDNQDSR
jgi:NAD-dependent SIR2 family protein deacetylase